MFKYVLLSSLVVWSLQSFHTFTNILMTVYFLGLCESVTRFWLDFRRSRRSQSPLLFEQVPHALLADEYDEDEDTSRDVDDVRWNPNPFGSEVTGGERNDFHHPWNPHQDEQAEYDSESNKSENWMIIIPFFFSRRFMMLPYFCLLRLLLVAKAVSMLAWYSFVAVKTKNTMLDRIIAPIGP